MAIQISKANPIELYITGETVYNQKSNNFMDFKEFFQKAGCTDQIKLQFTDTEEHQYRLRIKDENDVEVVTIPFVIAVYGSFFRYTISFDFQTHGVCEQKVSLEIYHDENSLAITASDTIETIAATLVVDQTMTIVASDTIETISATLDVTTPPQSDSFRISTSQGTNCAATPQTLYWASGAWGTGKTMYYDSNLSSLVTGFTHISTELDGEIFNLGSGDGIVGATTGVFC